LNRQKFKYMGNGIFTLYVLILTKWFQNMCALGCLIYTYTNYCH